MPKGQYDRSKSKAQRDAEKAAKGGGKGEVKQKRKYTRRTAASAPESLTPVGAMGPGLAQDSAQGHIGQAPDARAYEHRTLFTTLVEALPKIDNAALKAKVEAVIIETLSLLNPALVTRVPTEAQGEGPVAAEPVKKLGRPKKVADEDKGQPVAPEVPSITEAPAQASSIPFPAPLPFNGQAPSNG